MTVTAVSRDDPQAKLRSATTIPAPAKPGWFMTKSGRGLPAGSYRRSLNSAGFCVGRGLPRKRAGMIWSVSRFGWSIGIATAVKVVKGSMAILLGQQAADVGEMAGHGGRNCHRRAEQM